MNSFDLADVLAEYSRAVRLALIALESLHGLPGIDPQKILCLMQSFRRSHAEIAGYLAALIQAASAAESRPAGEFRARAAGSDGG